MTHKQKAIESLCKLKAWYERVRPSLTRDEQHVFADTITDLSQHVTLMEPVENPAKLPDTMPRVPLPRGPINLDAEEGPVLAVVMRCRVHNGARVMEHLGSFQCEHGCEQNNIEVRR